MTQRTPRQTGLQSPQSQQDFSLWPLLCKRINPLQDAKTLSGPTHLEFIPLPSFLCCHSFAVIPMSDLGDCQGMIPKEWEDNAGGES